MKSLLFLTILFLLISCDTPNVGQDHYRFENKEYIAKSFSVRIIEHPNIQEIKKAYDSETNVNGRVEFDSEHVLVAYSRIHRDQYGEICTIHIVDPSISYEPAYIGHEFTHCVYGQFHPNQM